MTTVEWDCCLSSNYSAFFITTSTGFLASSHKPLGPRLCDVGLLPIEHLAVCHLRHANDHLLPPVFGLPHWLFTCVYASLHLPVLRTYLLYIIFLFLLFRIPCSTESKSGSSTALDLSCSSSSPRNLHYRYVSHIKQSSEHAPLIQTQSNPYLAVT